MSTGEASAITRIAALLSGAVNPGREATTYHFVYIDQAGYATALAQSASDPYAEGASTTAGEIPAGSETVSVPSLLATGLLAETTYHYALVAHNAAGTVTGNDETFTTGPATPPLASTGPAGNITLSSATLSGTVKPQGLQTGYAFEVSSDPNDYGPATGAGSIDIGVEEAGVTLGLQGLQPGTTYYYRVLATSLDGTSYGVARAFTTPQAASSLTPPPTLPLIGAPAIAFPTETVIPVTSAPTRKLTRAQQLARALKTCKKTKGAAKRAACVKHAKKLYGPVRPAKRASTRKTSTKRTSKR